MVNRVYPLQQRLLATVYDIIEYLAGGISESEILTDFPSVCPEDIRACLAFAAQRERRLSSSQAA